MDTPIVWKEQLFESRRDAARYAIEALGYTENDFPIVAQEIRKECGIMPCEYDVAREICQDFSDWSDFYDIGEADRIFYLLDYCDCIMDGIERNFLDSCYFGWDEPPEIDDGLADVRQAIAVYVSWNRLLFRFFGDRQWFDPKEHSLFYGWLKSSLLQAETRLERQHFTFVAIGETEIEYSEAGYGAVRLTV